MSSNQHRNGSSATNAPLRSTKIKSAQKLVRQNAIVKPTLHAVLDKMELKIEKMETGDHDMKVFKALWELQPKEKELIAMSVSNLYPEHTDMLKNSNDQLKKEGVWKQIWEKMNAEIFFKLASKGWHDNVQKLKVQLQEQLTQEENRLAVELEDAMAELTNSAVLTNGTTH